MTRGLERELTRKTDRTEERMIVGIVVVVFLLSLAVAVPGLMALWRYPRRFGSKTTGFDTPGYLLEDRGERRRRSEGGQEG